MTFCEFLSGYSDYYRKGFPWMYDHIQGMMSNGITTFELCSDEIQRLQRLSWVLEGMAERQFYRTHRDLLIYVTEDWIKLRDTGENIFKYF